MRVGDELAARYRLEQRLGQGGMGEVWRAHDTALERAVAVKVLLEAATSDELVARFRREATIGARLQHPGITVVHDVGQEDGRLFIVTELLAGEDLRTALTRAPGGMPVAVALDLAAQTAEALAVAHAREVIHRDLKPANLFLLPTGRLKICDFGIAHSSDATAGWTVTGRIFGSPPYMAPEQWRGERMDARCDLYALGGVLYALLSGEPPFGEAEVPYVLMRRHIEDRPLPLREAGAPVAPEVDRLVLRLLAKDPADRPESADAVAKALRGLLGPARASPAPPTARPEPSPRAPAGPPHSSAAAATAPAAPPGPGRAAAGRAGHGVRGGAPLGPGRGPGLRSRRRDRCAALAARVDPARGVGVRARTAGPAAERPVREGPERPSPRPAEPCHGSLHHHPGPGYRQTRSSVGAVGTHPRKRPAGRRPPDPVPPGTHGVRTPVSPAVSGCGAPKGPIPSEM